MVLKTKKISICIISFFYLALQNMYKLLKPTHIGINYMVERLQDHISTIGNERIQSLKGENVCDKKKCAKMNEIFPFSYQQHLWKRYLKYILNI
jgi:hypothetical protein